MAKHYISMSGDHGCLPDHCEVYPNKTGAIDDLVALFDDVRGVKSNLAKYGIVELPRHAGAEYAEVITCNCPAPWEHSEMSKEEFIRERGDEFGVSEGQSILTM